MRRSIIMIWSRNKIAYLTAVIFLLGALPFTVLSQEKKNYGLNELENLFEAHDHEVMRYSNASDKPKNEVEFLVASGFNIYKAFFSSQDNPSCVFHPSCSVYTVQTIQANGLFLGTLQAFDRLSRCHRLIQPGQYFYDKSKQRFYDPVR